jgi:CRP-like cAMP-binding protein
MQKKPQASLTTKNFILNALPKKDFERLHAHLEPVELALGEIIYRPDKPIKYIYFPENSMASIVATTSSGQCVEVGVVGREGIVGVNVLLGVDSIANECFMQRGDGALRMKTETARQVFKEGGAFQDLSLRFINFLMLQISQTALCNRLHSVEEKLCRWLLMYHDRAENNKLTLTQEFLSIMLGVNRPSVTTVAVTLQGAGLIKYSRGLITIIERQGIEDLACDCYQAVKDEYDRLPK